MIVTEDEIGSLVDRLRARAANKMFDNQPHLQADLRLAARLLHHLIKVAAIWRFVELEEEE
jgi:hypothetical protein